MDVKLQFRRAKPGYEPQDVIEAAEQMTSSAVEAEARKREVDEQIGQLVETLAETQEKLNRLTAKPTYADLGAAFEQTLRVSEEQAKVIVKDATAEAQVIRETARADAEDRVRKAREEATRVTLEADGTIEDNRVETERRRTELDNQAEALLVQARTSLETAQRRGAKFISETEIAASDRRARLHQEVEDIKTELVTTRQIAERDQLRIDYDIKIAEDEAERERLARNEEAVAHVERLSEEASSRVAQAVATAGELTNQAESELATLRTQADTILRDAREEAARAIAEARRLAENLVTRYEEYSTEAFGDAEARVEWLENQTRVMDSFSFELRSLSSTDVQVVLDEASSEGDIDKANAARG